MRSSIDDLLVELFGALDQLLGQAADLARRIIVQTLDLDGPTRFLGLDSLIIKVLDNCFSGFGLVGDAELLAEARHVLTLLVEAGFHLIDVQASLSVDLARMWHQQDVTLGFDLQRLGVLASRVEIVVLKQSNQKLGKAVTVDILFSKDDRECDLLQSVLGQRGDLSAGSLSTGLRLGLILGTAQQERRDHVAHQVGVFELNHVQVCVAKVGSIGEKRGKETVRLLSGEAEHGAPVQQPRGLVKHVHRLLSEADLEHLLDASDSSEFSGLSGFLVQDFARQQTPQDLTVQGALALRLGRQNLLQAE